MKRVPTSGLVMLAASEIHKHPDNPRRGDIDQIVASIKANGFYGALLIQRSTQHIIAGNHRFEAGLSVGMTEFPCFVLDVTDLKAKQIMLADNRTNDLAGYDDDSLADLLSVVSKESGLDGTGYTDDDLEDLIRKCDTARPSDEELKEVKQANVTFNLLQARFIVERDNYERWLEEIRQSAGFSKSDITKEILCRLGL